MASLLLGRPSVQRSHLLASGWDSSNSGKCFRILVGEGVPHGCPTTTIDSGAATVATAEMNTELTFAAVILALNADTVLTPLFATIHTVDN